MTIWPANMMWSMQLCLLLGFINVTTGIRLVNGSSCSGRVEVLHNGTWGTVCDDGWDLTDAAVVCREMECGDVIEAKSTAYFGQGSGQIWLDNVNCDGTESSLKNCRANEWGKHNCEHHEDAGVICNKIRKKTAMRLQFNVDPKTELNDKSKMMEILEKIKEILKDSGAFTLQWRTQSNGEVFQKATKKKNDPQYCEKNI